MTRSALSYLIIGSASVVGWVGLDDVEEVRCDLRGGHDRDARALAADRRKIIADQRRAFVRLTRANGELAHAK